MDEMQAIAAEDPKLFNDMLAEAVRLSVIMKTGNVAAWEQWKKDQDARLDLFLRETQDASALDALSKRLENHT